MTTGSWTVGDGGTALFAQKQWSGGDGKTEPWNGGIRSKWNSYDMFHAKRRMTLGSPYLPALPPNYSMLSIKGTVGWSVNDELNMLDKLAQLVRGHSFDLGVNMAEAHKTYGTIVGNLRSIGSALLSLKRGNISQALRTLGSGRIGPRRGIRPLAGRDLSARWLETQYAFMPLISQSFEAAKALEAVTRPRVLRFSAGSRTLRKTLDFDFTSLCKMSMYVTYSQRVTAELSEPLSLGRTLGLTNPAQVAWEVVPYSFVVDWFIPVGTYISAFGIIPKLQGRFMITERGALKFGPVRPAPSNAPEWKEYAKANNRMEFFRTKRTPTSSLSVPVPTFNSLPRALSPKRLLNAVALIHQSLRS